MSTITISTEISMNTVTRLGLISLLVQLNPQLSDEWRRSRRTLWWDGAAVFESQDSGTVVIVRDRTGNEALHLTPADD